MNIKVVWGTFIIVSFGSVDQSYAIGLCSPLLKKFRERMEIFRQTTPPQLPIRKILEHEVEDHFQDSNSTSIEIYRWGKNTHLALRVKDMMYNVWFSGRIERQKFFTYPLHFHGSPYGIVLQATPEELDKLTDYYRSLTHFHYDIWTNNCSHFICQGLSFAKIAQVPSEAACLPWATENFLAQHNDRALYRTFYPAHKNE